MKRVLALLVVVALGVVTSTGCCPLLESTSDKGGAGEGGAEITAPSLEQFLDADAKSGSYATHTEWFGGDSFDQTGEFWVDGRLFRYDIYEDGTLVRSVMSPDGETAYFVYHDGQVCEPSVASVDYYLGRSQGSSEKLGVAPAAGSGQGVSYYQKELETDPLARRGRITGCASVRAGWPARFRRVDASGRGHAGKAGRVGRVGDPARIVRAVPGANGQTAGRRHGDGRHRRPARGQSGCRTRPAQAAGESPAPSGVATGWTCEAL